MKNKYEAPCYVCCEIVEEEKGLLEPNVPDENGHMWRKWRTRHKECKPQIAADDINQSNQPNA